MGKRTVALFPSREGLGVCWVSVCEMILLKNDITDLGLLYQFIKTLQLPQDKPQLTLMSKLKTVKIHAPSDFAQNIDAYLNGERHVK
jgi:hypothetical protein